MSKSLALRNQRAQLFGKMQETLDKAEAEKRDVLEDENIFLKNTRSEIDKLDEKIEQAEWMEKRKTDMDKIINQAPNQESRETKQARCEFRNIGEYMYTLVSNPSDSRLQELRAQQMKDGTLGGYAIPEQFRAELLSISPQEAVVRPRATVIPAGTPPDAPINMPALDQGASRNMYGGVIIYHAGESDTMTESNFRLKKITLTPKKMYGYLTISNELLNNWDAASSVIQNQLRLAMIGAEDTDFLTGDGVNKAKGIRDSNCAVNINRATASQIGFADVRTMYARSKFGGSQVWVASQTIIPQLVQIVDASSMSIWINSVREGLPPTLFGLPVLFNDRSPALGSKGDLMLCDMGYYLVKDGSGPNVAVSEHFRFNNDEVAFRVTKYVDGQSWLNEPIALEGSTANTVSPFVVLDVP